MNTFQRHSVLLKLLSGDRANWYLWIPIIGTLLIFAVLLAVLVADLFSIPTDTVLFLWRHRLPQQLITTFVVVGATVVSTVVIGSGYGWIISRFQFPGARIIKWLLFIPIAIPTYVMAYCARNFFSYSGPLAALSDAVGVRYPFAHLSIEGVGVAIVVLTSTLYPYVYLIARHTFRVQSRMLLEAAAVHRGRLLFFRIGLPLMRPALIAGAALVAMETLNEYGALFYLGVDTMTTAIFNTWFNYHDIQSASQIASYTLVVVIIIAIWELCVKNNARYNYGFSQWKPLQLVKLKGATQWIVLGACLVPIMIAVVMPLSVLVYWFDVSTFLSPELMRAITQSIMLALSATTLCLVGGLVLAYSRRIINNSVVNVVLLVVSLGYALPGAVVAVGLMQSVHPFIPLGGLAILMYGYFFRHLAVSYYPINASFENTCGLVDDAAYSLGASHIRRLVAINIPHMRYTLIGTALLIFVDILKELPLTIILRPLGVETLALQTFYYMSEEQAVRAAAPALAIVIIAVIAVLIIEWYIDEKRARTSH